MYSLKYYTSRIQILKYKDNNELALKQNKLR